MTLAGHLKKGGGLLPVVGLLSLLLVILALMSQATENSAHFSRLYSWLLLSSASGLLLLAALIGYNLYRLLRQYRADTPGSRLTLRLVVLFVVIAIAPVAVVYYFSLQFLQRGIDSWFDIRVETALEDALELSRSALDLRLREALKIAPQMADELSAVNDNLAALKLAELLNTNEATEMTLFTLNGHIIATANIDPRVIVPNRPPESVLLQAQRGRTYVSLDPLGESDLYIRAVVRIPATDARREERLLQVLFPITDRFSRLARSVQLAFDSYKELVFLRTPLKVSFMLTLSLVMLLAVLSAFWAAFYSARRLVKPVRALAAGTQAVAAGRYDRQLDRASNDELGFLVDSFNQMTRRLAQARDAAQHSQQLVERQRAYLEAVLARLSSGVLTLDHDGRLRTCNATAGQILGLDLNALLGAPMTDGSLPEPLRQFFELINPHLAAAAGDWRRELTLFSGGGRQVLMCRGSVLPDPVGLKGGHVIVFDDITNLVQAERDAAWGEVARRLAHEIKNPLTPIQLAAERIRHKYLKNMDGEQGRVLDRSTHTIVQQVQAMKTMVDDFKEYANPPVLQLATVALNDFITEVLYLYGDYPAGVEIELDLDPSQPVVEADEGRLRQLVHNLVKNAIEAIKDGQGSTLWISTRRCSEVDADYVELSFQDDGPGFPDGEIGNIFEPYVTTKPKGTGLGLAIVKKIVEEHGGMIRAESPQDGGARVVINFPLRLPTAARRIAIALLNRQSENQSNIQEAG